KSLYVSVGNAQTSIRVWYDPNEITGQGIFIGTSNPPVVITYEEFGQLLYQDWYVLAVGGAGNIVTFVENIITGDYKGVIDATRKQPNASERSSYIWDFPRTKRRKDRTTNILTPDDSLHNIVSRYRRFRSRN